MKKLQGAVIMISSLFWENSSNCIDFNEPRSLAKKRSQWRKKLEMPNGNLITLPIRYDRKSSSRFFTFTMAFSNSIEEKGQGYYVPYKERIRCV